MRSGKNGRLAWKITWLWRALKVGRWNVGLIPRRWAITLRHGSYQARCRFRKITWEVATWKRLDGGLGGRDLREQSVAVVQVMGAEAEGGREERLEIRLDQEVCSG